MSEKNWDFGKYFELHAIKVAAFFYPVVLCSVKGPRMVILQSFKTQT